MYISTIFKFGETSRFCVLHSFLAIDKTTYLKQKKIYPNFNYV